MSAALQADRGMCHQRLQLKAPSTSHSDQGVRGKKSMRVLSADPAQPCLSPHALQMAHCLRFRHSWKMLESLLQR